MMCVPAASLSFLVLTFARSALPGAACEADCRATFPPSAGATVTRPMRWPAALFLLGVLSAAGSVPRRSTGSVPPPREEAVPGCLELSDGTVRPRSLRLPRDAWLKIDDEKKRRHRLVPLGVVRQIDCAVAKEWTEKEWPFKENASDENVFTNRTDPAREYVHTIALSYGKTICGPLSAIVHGRAQRADEPERFLLHKRDKGEPGSEIASLVYVCTVRLERDALEEGKTKPARPVRQAKGRCIAWG